VSVVLIAVLFLLGVIVGSFITVVTEDAEGYAWLKRKRSKCLSCGHKLAVKDLFPLLSYLFLRGKCRYCGKKIGKRHLLIELGSGVAYAAVFVLLNFDVSPKLFLYLLIITVLIALSVTDLRFWTLPDTLVSALAVLALIKTFVLGEPGFSSSLIGGIAGLLSLGIVVVLSRGKAMGMGDVKLAGAMGLLFGWPQLLLALIIAFVLGGAFGAMLILLKKATAKSAIPFGPFLTFATVLLLLFPGLYSRVLLFYGLM